MNLIETKSRSDIGKEESMLCTLLCANRKSSAAKSLACCSASTFGVGIQVALLSVGDVALMKTVVVKVANSVLMEVMFLYAIAVVVVATFSLEVTVTVSKIVFVTG